MGVVRRRILAGLVACAGVISPSVTRADYPVCGIDLDQFRRLAFTDTFGQVSSEMLVKWAKPPDLMVLSPAVGPDLAADIRRIEAAARRHDFWRDFTVTYRRYVSTRELPTLVTGVPRNTVFVIVDDVNFDASAPVDADVQHALRIILLMEGTVDNLLGDARRADAVDQATRIIVNLSTGEAVASASLIRSGINRREILAAIFMSYLQAISPTLLTDEEARKPLFRWLDLMELTPVGSAFFKTLTDERVPVGSTKDFFVKCSN